MSQIPPIPPQPAPQPPYPPPQPAAPTAYTLPAPPRTNGLAITSLIVGILGFCVPFAGGALAVLFGGLGLRSASRTHSGRGLAIAGLVLGILSLGMWLLFSSAIWALVAGTKPNRALAGQYLRDLAAGNVSAAMVASDSSAITQPELEKVSETLKGFGAVKDVTSFSTNVVNDEAALAGVVTYEGGKTVGFDMKQRKVGGQWRVTSLRISEAGAVKKDVFDD